MRLCRFEQAGKPQLGFYDEQRIIPLAGAARVHKEVTHEEVKLPDSTEMIDFLPPDGAGFAAARKLSEWLARSDAGQLDPVSVPTASAKLLVPIPRPNKLFLLAGNYAAHIEEGGGVASERAETFPYVFMKPPTTTLTNPGEPIQIPGVSPDHIDWELELAVVIGKRCKAVKEADALVSF